MFIESDSGRILNLTHVADLYPVVGGSYRLRWSNGMSETLTSTDGEAIREAIKASEATTATPKPKPRGRPRKTQPK